MDSDHRPSRAGAVPHFRSPAHAPIAGDPHRRVPSRCRGAACDYAASRAARLLSVDGHATGVDGSVYKRYSCGVAETTTIRISRDTHARVTRLAAERHETIDETVSRAIRALRQDAMARDLAAELSEDEAAWLDADAG